MENLGKSSTFEISEIKSRFGHLCCAKQCKRRVNYEVYVPMWQGTIPLCKNHVVPILQLLEPALIGYSAWLGLIGDNLCDEDKKIYGRKIQKAFPDLSDYLKIIRREYEWGLTTICSMWATIVW